MTPSELKFEVERHGHESHFFTRRTMKFFGDTMRNYGVRNGGVVMTHSNDIYEVWELHRKRAVKHGVRDSAFFDKSTFRRIFPNKFVECDKRCNVCGVRFHCYTQK